MPMSIKPNLLSTLSNDELIKIMIEMKVSYDKELNEAKEKNINLQRIYDSCVNTLSHDHDTANCCSKCNLWFEEGRLDGGFMCEECYEPFCFDCDDLSAYDESPALIGEFICKCCIK